MSNQRQIDIDKYIRIHCNAVNESGLKLARTHTVYWLNCLYHASDILFAFIIYVYSYYFVYLCACAICVCACVRSLSLYRLVSIHLSLANEFKHKYMYIDANLRSIHP